MKQGPIILGWSENPQNRMPCIDFSEVVPGATITKYNENRYDAVEMIVIVTGKSRRLAFQDIGRMDKETFDSFSLKPLKLQGKGNHKTYTVHISELIEFVMAIPGKASKVFRMKFADIIVRYLDGDVSMCAEIKKNKSIGKSASYTNFIRDTMKQIMEEQEQEQAGRLPKINYIYASKSAAFPGLIKIGKTQDVAQRLSQLNTGCAPAPHTVVAVATTFNKDKDEKEAHQHFAAFRREGEFFEVSELDVQTYFSLVTAKFHVEMNQRLQGSLIHAMS